MNNMIVTILDAGGIQGYVFGSNKLKDNIGASHLVNEALNSWPLEILQDNKKFSGKVNPETGDKPDELISIFDSSKLDAELFYAGGGNTVIFFSNKDKAKDFAREYSIKLIENAPGLQVRCIHYEIKGDKLAEEVEDAFIELAKRKAAYEPGSPLLGLGVTAHCSITRRPANCIDIDKEDNNWPIISNEIEVKRSKEVRKQAEERIRKELSSILIPENRAFPRYLDNLGRTYGETSYIGVVHIDGNGMAKKVNKLNKEHKGTVDPKKYIKEMRELSCKINMTGKSTLKTAMNYILGSIHPSGKDDEPEVAKMVKLKKVENEKGKHYLPIRFLVYGGDDITFVCDGRIAIDLAAFMLKTFQDGDKDFYACAGVAIVKSHYPFARAYKMAGDLCKNAKDFVRKNFNGSDASAIDWHISAGGVETGIRKIRDNEYTAVSGETLTLRPYIIPKDGLDIPEGHSWQCFREEILDGIVNPDGDWTSHKSKLRELAGVIREGKKIAEIKLKRLREKNNLSLPGNTNWSEKGFYGNTTPYLDAIELLDMIPYSQCWGKKEERGG